MLKRSGTYLAAGFILAFMVLILVPVWVALGAVETEEDGHHGGGMMLTPEQFEAKVREQREKYGQPDGSVKPPPGDVYILARQFVFSPSRLRLETGEHYTLHIYSPDVIHGYSLVMERSLNTVVLPRMMSMMEIELTRPGEILVTCNEYCGLGHHLMRGLIIAEGEVVPRLHHHQEEEEHHPAEEEHTD
jgi:cytochrome c oxidase subunit 2